MRYVLGGFVLLLVLIIAFVTLPPLFIRMPPSCPNHDYPVRSEDDTFSVVPLAGDITQIPEFHDCQRFLVRNPRSGQKAYGPLAGIWVAMGLAERLTALAAANLTVITVPPRTPDRVNDSTNITPPPPATPPSAKALAFAQIYSWDGDYLQLGIAKRWNCLYLYLNPDTLHLGAKMLSVGKDLNACLAVREVAQLQGDSVTDLQVTRDTIHGASAADFPPVGRWDWDRKHQQQYIGLRCGTAWCEVSGKPGLTPSPTYSTGGGTPAQERVLAVKGWYDEQTLAVKPQGWTGALLSWMYTAEPASFSGTIAPDPELDGKPIEWFSEWRRAGQVAIGESFPKYHGTFNFGPGSMPMPGVTGRTAVVFLCHGTGCGDVPTCRWDNGLENERNWWARVEYEGTIKYRCVRRVDHSAQRVVIPGTARWFWSAGDEKAWFGCAAGCCTVQ